jgi:hypothetical protein
MVIKWAGNDPNFTDQYSGYSSWAALPTASSALPYRCMWTNELR